MTRLRGDTNKLDAPDAGPRLSCPPGTERVPDPNDGRWPLLGCDDAEGKRVRPTGTAAAPTDAAVRVQARKAYTRGARSFREARYGEAARFFLEAYRLEPFAAFLYNAGVAYEKFDPCAALQYFTAYLVAHREGADAEKVADRVRALAGQCTSKR